MNAKTILVYKTWETGENLEENVHVGDVRGGVNHCKWRGLTKDIPTASIVQCRWEAAEGINGDSSPRGYSGVGRDKDGGVMVSPSEGGSISFEFVWLSERLVTKRPMDSMLSWSHGGRSPGSGRRDVTLENTS